MVFLFRLIFSPEKLIPPLGTPMQNNYTELWNVVDLAQTNYLGTREDFIRDIDRPLLRGR